MKKEKIKRGPLRTPSVSRWARPSYVLGDWNFYRINKSGLFHHPLGGGDNGNEYWR
jgi:hypothetical protein